MKTIITVFGATGNLMHKKLIPAFNQLIKNNNIPSVEKIICVSRRDYTNEDYIHHLEENIKKPFEEVKPYLEYVNLDIHTLKDYVKLSDKINAYDATQNLFYLAVAPEYFIDIAKGLSISNLIKKDDISSRIVFEKPFGVDFASAKVINRELSRYFTEKQIYRIDHYLGKDMIQNILVMRFANKLVENNWDKESIEKVEIFVKEKESVGLRGPYYDHAGALKDMVQSHLLQVLALSAMEVPASVSSDDIRKSKVDCLKKTSFVKNKAVFGQYDTYHKEKGVPKESKTETFVFVEAHVDTPRWNGVPFYLMTGKSLDEKTAEIIVTFKDHSDSHNLWPNVKHTQNQLIIGISDYEGIAFKFNVKKPGLDSNVTDALLDYCHSCQKIGNNPEAYEKLFIDFIDGNQTLFTSWEEIEASWNIVDELTNEKIEPVIYHDIEDLKIKINQVFGEDI